jgi:deazaflavin-dependent oxidoreductase (nitroreductase family)
MPSDLSLKAMNLVHRGVIRASGGRLGWSIGGVRALALTTTGRTSGRPRSVMLTGFDEVPGGIVVIASRGGDDRQPDWFLNLSKDPEVRVAVDGGPPVPMRARVLAEPERAALFDRIAARHKHYAGYQRRTQRVIPVVVLEPVLGPGQTRA